LADRALTVDVRYSPKADMPRNAINVAIGGKADMEITTYSTFGKSGHFAPH